jgi:hypothetical protein
MHRAIQVSLMLLPVETTAARRTQIFSIVSAESRRRGKPGRAAVQRCSRCRIDWDQFLQASFARKMRPGVNESTRGVSMTTLTMESAVTAVPARQDFAANGCRSPMSQQAAFASNGHDIHPQTFVRLVGCHQSRTRMGEAT